ncbi:MAG: right-handed parallel beta-helix repeat-containing protein [Oscillospiraceae bacterium]|nr:right-handed parallel beta-helix repeat-containing protein [Oscillospiraceae bacterium]
MKKEKEVPTVKCAVLAFCFSILTLMSACAAAPAEAAGSPAEQIAAIEETTETEDAVVPDAEQEETTVSGETEEPAASAYDTSAQYSAAVLADDDEILGGTYIAEGDDESVLEASGSVQASVTGAVLQKLGGSASSADASSFRGVNAGVRVYGSAAVGLTDCEILATAPNATGVFAYEDGVIYMDNCTVNVTGGGAGGVQVAGGGTLIGQNLTVTSASKAAIRSDRGGGTLILDGGSYTSTGSNGCPAIYSTADITVRNADCISENSRAVIIEGKNSVTLENCTLIGNDQSTKEGSVHANVLLYQSASGDASEGTSVFSMAGGSMTCRSGAMFYCTNTASKAYLTDAELILSEDGTLLIVSAGRWGKDGRNGGNCAFAAQDQTLEGDILVDSISTLVLDLTNSSYTGAIRGEGSVSVTMDAASTWTLTGDSYITALDGDLSGLDLNGYTLFINGVAFS